MEETTPETIQWVLNLSPDNIRKRLEWYMESLNDASLKLSRALKGIRDDRAYRADYSSFEEFCSKRLGISRAKAYQMIAAQEVEHLLRESEVSSIVDGMSDRAKIALKGTTLPEAEKIVKDLSTNGDITEKAIREARKMPPASKPKPPTIHTCPQCQHQFQ